MARRSRTKEAAKAKQSAKIQSQADRKPPATADGIYNGLGLKLLVFAAGAVLMGLEIAGSRVLAPHFGNSVFVWGSLISIFLMALSLGYYFGGRLADRHPSHVLLNTVCLAVAAWIFVIAIVAQRVCEVLVQGGLGEQSGPLVASILLFLPPSIGMGMVSPFAIRLATSSVGSVGKISGTLYALSTMGSIAGTMATTFLLIPLIGLAAILKGLGLVLLLAAVVTFPWWKRGEGGASLAGFSSLALFLLVLPGPPRTPLTAGELNVVDVDTPYHHISVIDNPTYEVREMRFDRYTESAISLVPPYRSLAAYTDYFHLAVLAKPKIERSLFIGAGGGIGPRTFQAHDPQMVIDLVDIDPKVLEIARSHFFLDTSAGIRTIAEDGRMFVRQTEHKYDCVILDAFTIGGRIPFHLVTREFLELCRNKMADDGVFVMNINSAIDGPRARIFHSMYRTIDSVFPHTYAFAKDHRLRGDQGSMNIILLATGGKQRIARNQWAADAEQHRSNSYVGRSEMQRAVADLLAELPDMSRAPLFTDDYAPIETMPF